MGDAHPLGDVGLRQCIGAATLGQPLSVDGRLLTMAGLGDGLSAAELGDRPAEPSGRVEDLNSGYLGARPRLVTPRDERPEWCSPGRDGAPLVAHCRPFRHERLAARMLIVSGSSKGGRSARRTTHASR